MVFDIVIKTSQQLDSEARTSQHTPPASSRCASPEHGDDTPEDDESGMHAPHVDSGYNTGHNSPASSRHASPTRGLVSSTSDLAASTVLSRADTAITSPHESPASSRCATPELESDDDLCMSGALHRDEESPPSPPRLFGDTILHNGQGLQRRTIPPLTGFCQHSDKCSCVPLQRPQAPQTIPLAKNQVGTQFLFSPEARLFFPIDKRKEAEMQGVWVTQTIQVLGTRVQLRRAGMVPVHHNSPYLRENDIVEGLFVKERGYMFPPELDLEIQFQEERTEGFVAVTINLNDKMPEDEEICLPWTMDETGTVSSWRGSALLCPWTRY